MTAPGADIEAIKAYLAETDENLAVYINENQHTYLDVYLRRMHALHAAEADPVLVLKEAARAAKTYAENASLYLAKLPAYRIRSRRILPLELALMAGDGDTHDMLADIMGFDPMLLLAGTEPKELTAEVEEITPWFRRRKITDGGVLVGTLAVFIACAYASVVREDKGQFAAAVGTMSMMASDHWVMVRNPSPGVARVLATVKAFDAIAKKDGDALAVALAGHGKAHAIGYGQLVEKDPKAAVLGDGSLDTTSLALACIAEAFGIPPLTALNAAPDELKDDLAPLRRYAEVMFA